MTKKLFLFLFAPFFFLLPASFNGASGADYLPGDTTGFHGSQFPGDEVIITYRSSDVCGLPYLGEVYVTEKRWFSCHQGLKETSINELKQRASDKGGNIVYVDVTEKKGVGIFFSTTLTGYVYQSGQ